MSYARACSVGDVAAAGALQVEMRSAGGEQVAVAVVRDSDGTWHAIGDTCSHDDYSLAEGDVDEGEIECWKHGALFDIRSGKALTLPATTPVPVYAIEIEGDAVLVDVDAAS